MIFLIYRTGTFTVKGNTLLFVSSTSMSVMGISIMQPLTQAAPPPLCSQAAAHFLVKLEDENFPWPSNIHYKTKSFMQKKPMSLILANLKSLHVPEHRFPSIATTCRVSSLSKKVLLHVRKKKLNEPLKHTQTV